MSYSKPAGPSHRLRWTLAFVGWLCLVWGHSLMPGDASSAESSRFLFLVQPIFALFGNEDQELMTFVIRKTAHFSEYAILMGIGVGMAHAWFGRTRNATWLTLVLWVVIPSLDETIQLFVSGREGKPTDVLIDMAGGLLGMAVAKGLMAKNRQRGGKS